MSTQPSIEQLYPLSPYQKAILQDIVDSLAQRQRFLDQSVDDVSPSSDWRKFRLLLGKPGTGKSQVVIRAIHHAIQQGYAVLLVAPVALLAQGYRAIFGPDLDPETIHAAFHIPVNQEQAPDVASKGIGTGMMNSFDSFANLNRNHLSGITCIGNSGSSLCLSRSLLRA